MYSPADFARSAALGDFRPEVTTWLTEGFRRHLIHGLPVEAALQLDRASRIRARDKALRTAAELLAMGETNAWPVAERLARAIARFDRQRGEPSTELEHTLATAFKTGQRIPRTARHLYELIR